MGRRGPHPYFSPRPVLGPIYSYLNWQFANEENAGEALGPRILVGAEVGPLYLKRLCLHNPKILFPLPPFLPSTPQPRARSQIPQGGSETHIIIQIKFLFAHHRGAGFGFGKIFEAAGALKGELGEAEVLPGVKLCCITTVVCKKHRAVLAPNTAHVTQSWAQS